jgi:hypothetical protein
MSPRLQINFVGPQVYQVGENRRVEFYRAILPSDLDLRRSGQSLSIDYYGFLDFALAIDTHKQSTLIGRLDNESHEKNRRC